MKIFLALLAIFYHADAAQFCEDFLDQDPADGATVNRLKAVDQFFFNAENSQRDGLDVVFSSLAVVVDVVGAVDVEVFAMRTNSIYDVATFPAEWDVIGSASIDAATTGESFSISFDAPIYLENLAKRGFAVRASAPVLRVQDGSLGCDSDNTACDYRFHRRVGALELLIDDRLRCDGGSCYNGVAACPSNGSSVCDCSPGFSADDCRGVITDPAVVLPEYAHRFRGSICFETIQCYKLFDAQQDDDASPIQRLSLDSSFFFNVRNRITEGRAIDVNSFSVVVDAEFSNDVTIEVFVMTAAAVYDISAFPADWQMVGSLDVPSASPGEVLVIDIDETTLADNEERGFHIRALDQSGSPAAVLRGQDGSLGCGGSDGAVVACSRSLSSEQINLRLNGEVACPSAACEHYGTCTADPQAPCDCSTASGFGGTECDEVTDSSLVSAEFANRFRGGFCFDGGIADTAPVPVFPTGTAIPTPAPTSAAPTPIVTPMETAMPTSADPTPMPTPVETPEPTPYSGTCALSATFDDDDPGREQSGVYINVASRRLDGGIVSVTNFYVEAATESDQFGEEVHVFTTKDGSPYEDNFGDDSLWEELGVFTPSPFPANSLVDLGLTLNVTLNEDGTARGFFIVREDTHNHWHFHTAASSVSDDEEIAISSGHAHSSENTPGGPGSSGHYFVGLVCYEVTGGTSEPTRSPTPASTNIPTVPATPSWTSEPSPSPSRQPAPTPAVVDGGGSPDGEQANTGEADGMSPGVIVGIIIAILAGVLLVAGGVYYGRRKVAAARAPQTSGAQNAPGVEFTNVDED